VAKAKRFSALAAANFNESMSLAGAKARVIFCMIGTTKVVPFEPLAKFRI
jgi:hypothetical protein